MKSIDTSAVEMVTVVGVFPGYAEARRAVEELQRIGYREDQIGVVGSELNQTRGEGAAASALAGWGISETDVRRYVSELETGHVIVTVRAENITAAQRVLNEYGTTNRPSETSIPGNALPATPY